jgi:hypothetical protein
MALTVYTVEQAEQWDSVVRSFKAYDTYWLSGYVKAFQIHGDGEPLLFYYESPDTRGINVVMMRDVAQDERFAGKIPDNTCFDFATPYGYGGWIIEGTGREALFSAYANWAVNRGIISEFVRFHPMVKNHIACDGFYDVVRLGEVVHMDLSSPDMIWNNMTGKNRNVIRKAIKNDVHISNGRLPEIYEEFHRIYDGTMARDHAEKYYYFGDAFYKSLLNDLPQNAQVFWAEKDGETIAAAIMLTANGYMNYHLSGSLREYSSLAPGNLLLYKAALWGCENGCRTLYLGGGVGSEEDSLFKFKRAFYKGSLNYFYIGKRIFNSAKYDELVAIRGDMDSGFFPKYRAK